jgi:hypothetical protein
MRWDLRGGVVGLTKEKMLTCRREWTASQRARKLPRGAILESFGQCGDARPSLETRQRGQLDNYSTTINNELVASRCLEEERQLPRGT